jgi:ferredoxin
MGAGAINFINRGPYTVVNTPFAEPSKDCLGCGACANICPTHAVRLEDLSGERVLHSWSETKVPLSKCASCGKYFAPEALEKSMLSRIEPLLRDDLAALCPACRAKKLAKKEILAATGGDISNA